MGQNGTPQGMTKADLVELIYERVGSSKKEAGDVVEAVFAIIKDSLCRGEKVKISGFGSFSVNHKHARRGRNPQTGVSITIDSRTVLSFKPSQVLKERVGNGEKPAAASPASSGSSASSE
jgi:integration host factor subunit alpha